MHVIIVPYDAMSLEKVKTPPEHSPTWRKRENRVSFYDGVV